MTGKRCLAAYGAEIGLCLEKNNKHNHHQQQPASPSALTLCWVSGFLRFRPIL
jgi:hypothetical protein